jgi:hypothetical protein
MTLILNGTDGLSDVDGSAATPAIRGTDANTGIFFPAADTIAFSEGGVESMRIDASGRLLIGTTTASGVLTVVGSSQMSHTYSGAPARFDFGQYDSSGNASINNTANANLLFATNNVERARITSGGEFQFNSGYGSVATAYGCRAWVNFNGTGTVAIRASGNVSSITDGGVGTYTVNFTTAMPDANYCALVDMTPSTSNAGSDTFPITYQTTSIEVRHFEDNVQRDSVAVNVSVFR